MRDASPVLSLRPTRRCLCHRRVLLPPAPARRARLDLEAVWRRAWTRDAAEAASWTAPLRVCLVGHLAADGARRAGRRGGRERGGIGRWPGHPGWPVARIVLDPHLHAAGATDLDGAHAGSGRWRFSRDAARTPLGPTRRLSCVRGHRRQRRLRRRGPRPSPSSSPPAVIQPPAAPALSACGSEVRAVDPASRTSAGCSSRRPPTSLRGGASRGAPVAGRRTARLHAGRPLRQRRLGRGQPRDRNPVRRAGHVVEPDLWQNAIERGSPPCSPQMPILRSGRAPRPLRGHRDQLADALLIEHLEGILGEIPRSTYSGRKRPASSRLSPSVVCVRSLVPKREELAPASRSRPAVSAARGSSIIVPTRYGTALVHGAEHLRGDVARRSRAGARIP